ncbi:MAG TPA: GrpB family protein [Gammaproteobacteria bacterium]|nr:GrpB family protein [Gammaproteobacteria bacterium]
MTKMPAPHEAGLIGGREERNVEIYEYDACWPTMFEERALKLRAALGDAALRVEHIGSTSVPGLAAKPIIDILVVVADPGDEAGYLPALQQAGYELRVREPEFDEHRMVRTPERDVHVHIFPPQSKEIGRYLAFRNQLRSNAEDRSAYEHAKRTLAKRKWTDMNDYAAAKTEVVEAILAKGIAVFGKDGEAGA